MREASSTNSAQIVTMTFFRYAGFDKIWGMSQMRLAQNRLVQTPGLTFHKLLGSGAGNGFGLKPDFSVYALLCVWDDSEKSEQFFNHSKIFEKFKKHSVERWTIFMRALKSHGRWSGVEPFQTADASNKNNKLLGVITRATLRANKIHQFWRYVPNASRDFPDQPGLIFAKGIGELPVVQQATFSLWRSKQAMAAYAYRNSRHTEVIQKTRELGWYKEELFAQFQPFRSEGVWNGLDPLAGYLPTERNPDFPVRDNSVDDCSISQSSD